MPTGNRQLRGIGLIEVLLALAIGAALLTALAAALSTLIASSRTNQGLLQSRNNANASLNYILTHVRRARGLALSSPTGSANEYLTLTTKDQPVFDPATATWVEQFTVFRYSPAERTLSIGHGPGASPVAIPVLHNVSNLVFRSASDSGSHSYVTVEIAVETPQAASVPSFTIAGSAVARSL